MMTLQELLNKLEKYPKNATIYVGLSEGFEECETVYYDKKQNIIFLS